MRSCIPNASNRDGCGLPRLTAHPDSDAFRPVNKNRHLIREGIEVQEPFRKGNRIFAHPLDCVSGRFV